MKRYLNITLAAAIALSAVSCASHVTPKEPYKWAMQNYEQYSKEADADKDQAKQADIETLRKRFQKSGWRKHQYAKTKSTWQSADKLLMDDGRFEDLDAAIAHLLADESKHKQPQLDSVLDISSEIWNRLGIMADAVATGKTSAESIYTDKYLRSIVHYTTMELNRNNYSPRFHLSCFAIPTAATNIYYAFLDKMDAIESGATSSKLELEACTMLKTVALQAWTQPLRLDETDNDVSSIDRFRKHVWWVGGNGLSYRSLLPVACMIKSAPMVDVLAQAGQSGVSCTSQTTYDSSFWTEGITADGAGWGHGMQALVWGYPIDGTLAALSMLKEFDGTVWERKLNEENIDAIFNYLRGSNWYYYKGYNLPCLNRESFLYIGKEQVVKSEKLASDMLSRWRNSFTKEQIAELEQFQKEARAIDLKMEGYAEGLYNGTRYFFNNDDLIKKNNDYHLIVNMASVRVDGIESAAPLDHFNFTTCDGMTLFQRRGNEYKEMFGAFDVLQAPGITARLGVESLTPIRNWRGFCSKENFAGAATLAGENAVAGYIFDKMNASNKDGVNDTAGRTENNQILYGVQAHKSYFIFGDYMLALGAGVTNSKPELDGDIHTTIEQTLAQSDIYLLKNGRRHTIKSGKNRLGSDANSLEWLVQKGQFAYTSLPEYTKDSYYLVETRKSDWERVHPANAKVADRPMSSKVLQLWADHGHAPKSDTYGYVVYMGKGAPASTLPFEVYQNDTKIQAAASKDGKTIEIVFYDPTQSIKIAGQTISASAPCVVLLEADAQGWNLSVTDAQMNAETKNIDITINGTKHAVAMPEGLYCGKPATTKIK